jgi:hypothetical protein
MGDQLQDDDDVCLGDADDAVATAIPSSLSPGAHASDATPCHDNAAGDGRGWASAYGSVFVDPHQLEKAIRDKALLYHRKRQAKLKAFREEQLQSRHAVGLTSSPGATAAPQATTVPTMPFAFFSQRAARPPSAATTPQQTILAEPEALRTMRSVTRSLINCTTAALPFDPPRVHFSDTEDVEEEEPMTVRATMSLFVTSGASYSADPSVAMTIKKLKADTSAKKLLKRIRAAIRAHRRMPSSSSGGEGATKAAARSTSAATECSLWLQARCPETMDAVLEGLTLEEWHLSVRDNDGDYISIATNKEWKRALKEHVQRCCDGDEEDVVMIMRSDVLCHLC